MLVLLGGCLARIPPSKTFSVPRDAAGRKKKQNKRKNNQNTWISHKRTCLHGACKLHYEKENFIREDLTLNPCTPNSLSLEVPLTKALSLLEDSLNPLKCLATAVHEPCSFSYSNARFFLGSVRRPQCKTKPHAFSVASQGF